MKRAAFLPFRFRLGPSPLLTVYLTAGLLAVRASAQTADEPRPESAEVKASSVDTSDAVAKSVVKITATVSYPNHFKPWTKLSPASLVGSGVVIEGKRILSNAHLLLYSTDVQVEANESGDKFPAKVELISPEIDLAVLKLDDESFFANRPPLARAASLPTTKDAVTVYGFPTGGSSMSITKGIVSRIEHAKYNYGTSGLRLQVDAAINPGNSGGPAVVADKMVGLAFAHLSKAENISYIIPNEEIDLFLKSSVDNPYHGRPNLYVKLLGLQNAALRSFLHADKSVQGAVVEEVPKTPPGNPLRKWDIITRIGDVPLDNEAMVRLTNGLRVGFGYLAGQLARNGKAPLTVIREGKVIQLEAPLVSNPPQILPGLKGSYPSYFIYGPLVFCDAYQDFLTDLIGSRSSRLWTALLLDHGSPLLSRCDDSPAFDGERLVVVTAFLPHKLSRGYSDPVSQVVKSINGVPIKNLAHLVATLRDCKDEFIRFDFEGRDTDTLVFQRQEMIAATDDILNDNSARAQGSRDVMAIWDKKND